MPLRSLIVSAALLSLASAPSAQKAARGPTDDFVVSDILSGPTENLARVKSFGPTFHSPPLPYLPVPVIYLRGLAFDGPDSGYYVSGYSEGTGRPTGFFRFENGQSTLVAPFPLVKWGSLGDVTWSRKRDFLWYVWNPSGPQDTTLYRIDLSGTFTEVAEIQYANGATIDIGGGVALDRSTGVLYGYDQNRARLVTLDPRTALATTVGSSGLAPYPNTVIMSMDFSNEGRLFMIRNFGTLYEVDFTTGSATVAGGVATACSSLAFVPPPLVAR